MVEKRWSGGSRIRQVDVEFIKEQWCRRCGDWSVVVVGNWVMGF